MKGGPHDLGGADPFLKEAIDKTAPTFTAYWQAQVDAVTALLFRKKIFSTDEFRRFIEALPSNTYLGYSYYGKWASSILQLLLRLGLLKEGEVFEALYGVEDPALSQTQRFQVGERVKVKVMSSGAGLIRRPHIRTPGYLFGKSGVIESVAGSFLPPHKVSWNRDVKEPVTPEVLYRVRFRMGDIWEHAENPEDTVDAEIFQQWLIPKEPKKDASKHKHHDEHHHEHHHEHAHEHDHDHGHDHDTRTETERQAVEKEEFSLTVEEAAIGEALIALCLKNNIVTRQELLDIERERDVLEKDALGPKVVAKAWSNPEFCKKLLQDATPAVLEAFGVNLNVKVRAFQCTPQEHHVVVCTLCSCYPQLLLGRPPAWYKSRSYRARLPMEPRAVLTEFGCNIPQNVQIHVHDSTADLRYLIVPVRPKGSEGLSEPELAALINRDHLIGVSSTL